MAELDLLRFVLALAFVLGLIALAAWAVRRFRLGGTFMVPASERRLRLLEMLALDARHKLVLVRRDEVEHLIVLGPGAALGLEGGVAPSRAGDEGERG